MKSDQALFMAYAYGTAVGTPASEVMKLPIAEFTTGYLAYLKVCEELASQNGS